MKLKLQTKTFLLLALVGLFSAELNAQDETFVNTSTDGFWSNVGNWVNTSDGTTPSGALPTGEATISTSVDLN